MNANTYHAPFETVALDETRDTVVILDQTVLPHATRYLMLTSLPEVWEAIQKLQVRGAPAIGIAAAMGLYMHMKRLPECDNKAFCTAFKEAGAYLISARPTAVNLKWAVDRMTETFTAHQDQSTGEILAALCKTAKRLKADDTDVCRKIGEYGASLLQPGMGILTHCNAGALAASKYGTALAPIYVAHEQGVPLRVFADETRPLLQGARLTAYELVTAGVDVTLICDNMASSVMQKGWINAVFVGCDRVAANGDTANKIGTSGVAVLAAAYGIPFYVCAPFSTIDLACATGADIVIEERAGTEVTDLWYEKPMAPVGVKVYNPAFDVTPARYITAFVTERGILTPPFDTLPLE